MTDFGAVVDQHIETARKLKTILPRLDDAVGLCHRALANGNKILLFGNGGSAADAQHIAAELVGRFRHEREPLAAIALTTDSSVLTALANDYGYGEVFARQVSALALPGDVAIGLSTSGESENVRRGLRRAWACGCRTVALTGEAGLVQPKSSIFRPRTRRALEEGLKNGRFPPDITLAVPSTDTARIQEMHILLGHMLCEALEGAFCVPGVEV